ncbi:putative clathrin assembly protein At4g25940 isoform X2 [Raphanus sativus]|uniref:Clathrin assembly protein At4g25940 isoform X2 n=1 Tax=Raphanus sativus TaxID=3726 RepID=A0A6J0MDC7_RAPSA|nr:putative clathrin assembly protein At4g25940 isoform X2 [Raphanus sativus]
MSTFHSFRKAVGALKDSTTVSIAKVNSEFKDLDVAIVKATNHVESAPKERHIRKIFSATSAVRPRADVAFCIHALAKRLSRTHNWVVAIKVLIVIHRTLREGDPTFRDELLNYSHRGHILRISNFKDDTSPLAWDCSAWIRTYALFLEERLECYRVLKYDIEAERLPKGSGASSKNVDFNASQTYRTRMLSNEELLEQLPALQQLLFRLTGCKPEGAGYSNYLIQYALALVLKESFKIYCAINDGIINLVDLFFEMSRHDAVKALNIYKRAGQQAENLADFYEYCKSLELARNFQFPTLRQPPPSFLATMEEYIREAPQSGSVQKKLEYQEKEEEDEEEKEKEEEEEQSAQPEEPTETENQNENTEGDQPLIEEEEEETEQIEEDTKPSFLIDTDDLLGLSEINPKAAEIEDRNALALAIYPPGHEVPGPSNSLSLIETGGSGWELALVTPQNNNNNNNNIHRSAPDTKFAGGFDKLLLDSLYEDDSARRQIQLTNAGYGHGGTERAAAPPQNPFEMQQDPFAMSNNIAPPTNVQMAQQQQQQMMMHQNPYSYSNPHDYHHHQFSAAGPSPSNPFGDHFLALPAPPGSSGQQQQQNIHNHMLL